MGPASRSVSCCEQGAEVSRDPTVSVIRAPHNVHHRASIKQTLVLAHHGAVLEHLHCMHASQGSQRSASGLAFWTAAQLRHGVMPLPQRHYAVPLPQRHYAAPLKH